jgi:putative serine protease PepD
VIGIPTAAALNAGTGDSTGIGFAIPADTVTRIAGQLISAGQVSKPGQATLGLAARSATASSRQRDGAMIAWVSAGGPAATAGLRTGDVITSVDGSEIQSEAQLAALLAALKPGMQVYLSYTRSGVTQTANVTLGVSWS